MRTYEAGIDYSQQAQAAAAAAGEEAGGMALSGVKRRLEESADSMDTAQAELLSVKRLCTEMSPDPEGDNGIVLGHRHLTHFVTASQPQCSTLPAAIPAPIEQTGEGMEVHGCMKDVVYTPVPQGHNTPSISQALPPTHPHPSHVQGEPSVMWMDMDGETYSPVITAHAHMAATLTPTPTPQWPY